MSRFKLTPKIEIFIWWSFMIAGVLLRLRSYLLNPSFWADEASLALNLVNRTFGQLTQPLDYQQGAPIGFLFIEKFLMTLLGNNEYALRLFPLVAGILAVYLVYRLSREHFGISGLFVVAAFSIGWNLIYYSSELKQYSSDAAIALLLTYLAIRFINNETAQARDFIMLGAFGAFAIWISHPSFFTLAGIGLTLLAEKVMRRNYAPLSWIFILAAVWLASFGLQYFVSLRGLAADDYLQYYWSKAFAPMPPWNNKRWFFNTYVSMMGISLTTEDIAIFLVPVLTFIGGISLFIRKRSLALIFVLTALAALGASALQKYPLKGRFMLFLIPFFLLIIAEGLRFIYELVAKKNRVLALLLSGLPALWLVFFPVMVTYNEVRSANSNVGLRPVVQNLSEKRMSDDIIYVYHSAEPSFVYYAPLFGIDPKDEHIIIGKSLVLKKLSLEGFFKDADSLKGRGRVWFVFTDIVDCGGCDGDPQVFFVKELDKRGIQLGQSNGVEANAYLYNMNK
jgi:hypothetical protein